MDNNVKIIKILQTTYINENIVFDFFEKLGLNTCNLENVLKKQSFYPENAIDFFGTLPKVENNFLTNYKIIVPKIKNLYTALIFIHETIHGVILENRLNKPYDESLQEVLPMFFEDLFIEYLINNGNHYLQIIYEEYKKYIFSNNDLDKCYIDAREIIDQILFIEHHKDSFKNDLIKLLKNEIELKKYLETKKKIY